jgi:tetratricopeptide (TPR) repeat protein
MTARMLPPTGRAARDTELLRQLGLPASAAPEDLDQLHQAVSEYLAGAPASIRGWAHAQAASLDAAYLQLTDPVGLQGPALRSPTRPPAVEPGGPATPPARRDSAPAVSPAPRSADVAAAEAVEADPDDLEALFASVTPSVHRDSLPGRRTPPAARPATAAVAAPASAGGLFLPWRRVTLGTVAIAAAVAIAVFVYNAGVGGFAASGANPSPAASNAAPAIDQAKVAGLMERLQANPKDAATLLALADEFYAGGLYDNAGDWLDKLLAIEPAHVQALLARGAVSFNLGDLAEAEKTWLAVVAIEPDNVEVHYDLGFLYLNQPSPDLVGVQREWQKVVELGPGTQLATTVQAHLDSLVAASMLPGGSAAPSGSASPAPASAAPSPAASTQP